MDKSEHWATARLWSRRGALGVAGSAALAASVGLDAHAAVGGRDFLGTWHGSVDGHAATMTITGDSRITLLDHTTAGTYVGKAGAGNQVLSGVTLRNGNHTIVWRTLRLRRWRHDPLSGLDWWTENPADDPCLGLSVYRDRQAGPAVTWHSGRVERPDARRSVSVFDGGGDLFLLHLDRL